MDAAVTLHHTYRSAQSAAHAFAAQRDAVKAKFAPVHVHVLQNRKAFVHHSRAGALSGKIIPRRKTVIHTASSNPQRGSYIPFPSCRRQKRRHESRAGKADEVCFLWLQDQHRYAVNLLFYISLSDLLLKYIALYPPDGGFIFRQFFSICFCGLISGFPLLSSRTVPSSAGSHIPFPYHKRVEFRLRFV